MVQKCIAVQFLFGTIYCGKHEEAAYGRKEYKTQQERKQDTGSEVRAFFCIGRDHTDDFLYTAQRIFRLALLALLFDCFDAFGSLELYAEQRIHVSIG